ncbi:TonB-dependent receptor [Candidatus Methylacidiphilum infernorum]|uniref:Outer membrane receptor protein, mostly Fe transport n=1 Tax=Methylacidiphilum infernorum (isolate V4) TaxID=481448 RepID=B3DZS3_METI4|nr:TonB-dependent receptor [Candidatus Methylacidiphilum infernorum]ACD84258.1 Outer membrane receptor protein, mostly Fe transport [Methylacidiphilum infernorum V4]
MDWVTLSPFIVFCPHNGINVLLRYTLFYFIFFILGLSMTGLYAQPLPDEQQNEETTAPPTQNPSSNEFSPLSQSPGPALSNPSSAGSTPPNIPLLAPVIVTTQEELPEEENVVETNMEMNVLGTPMKVIDIPRTVQVVTRQELNTINAQTVNDLAAFTPGVVPSQQTGSPMGEPMIRGLPGTVFRNGMLVGFSQSGQYGPLMNMMAFENLDVVTGPVSIVYGPQELAGGFANELTKQPYFDKFRGNASYTLGMYDTNFWNIDIGGPILKDKLAYRFDYFGQDGYAPYNYYDGAYLQRQCFYLDLGAKPYENLSIDFNTELDINHFNTVAGLNRPTSALINDGLYQTGSWVGWYGPPGVFHPGIGTAPPGAGYAVSWGPLVTISPRTNLFANPEDDDQQAYYVAQLITSLRINDNLSLVNNTLFEYYSALIDQAIPSDFWGILPSGYNFDDRLELRFVFDQPINEKEGSQAAKGQDQLPAFSFHHSIDTGIEFRYFSDTEYAGVWHQPVNIWNLTQPLGYNAFSPLVSFAQATSPLFANPYLTDIPVPGYPGAFYNVFNYLSTADTFYELSPFYQHQIDFTDKWSLMVAARMNSYFIQASPPQGTPAILSAVAPSFGLPPYSSTSMNIVQPEVTISPSYKPFPWMNTYFTFFYGQTTLLSQFGSFAPEFPSAYYHQNNFLYEVGTKFNLLHDKLFLGLSGYYQTGFIPAQVIPGGPVATTAVAIKGAQLMGNYQPNKNFWLNFGYAFIVGQELWQGLPLGPLALQPYSSTVAKQLGLPVDPLVNEPPLNYPFIGFPTNYGNLMATYKFDSGLGISLWALAESGDFIFYTYSTRIPSWYTLNARIFYTSKRWEASLYLYNITDEHYWFAGAPGFSAARNFNYDYIVPQLPFWIQGTLSIFF